MNLHLIQSPRWEGWQRLPCDAAEDLITSGMVTRNPIGTQLDTDTEVVVEWVSPNGIPVMRDVYQKGKTFTGCVHWISGDSDD